MPIGDDQAPVADKLVYTEGRPSTCAATSTATSADRSRPPFPIQILTWEPNPRASVQQGAPGCQPHLQQPPCFVVGELDRALAVARAFSFGAAELFRGDVRSFAPSRANAPRRSLSSNPDEGARGLVVVLIGLTRGPHRVRVASGRWNI